MSRRWAPPRPLGDAVRRELDRLGDGPPGSAGIAAIAAAWPRAVGDAIARNAWPARLARDGTLVVHAASSAWAFELSQLEPVVRGKLGDVAPARLAFVVGPVPEPAVSSPETVSDMRRSVPRPSPEDARRGAEIAGAIEDPELRELAAKAAAASLARSEREAGATGPSGTIRNT